jgi:DNA (cytosine-5)-methyltransferase 1
MQSSPLTSDFFSALGSISPGTPNIHGPHDRDSAHYNLLVNSNKLHVCSDDHVTSESSSLIEADDSLEGASIELGSESDTKDDQVEELPIPKDLSALSSGDGQKLAAAEGPRVKTGLSNLLQPKSSYTGFSTQLPITSEQNAIQDLLDELKRLAALRPPVAHGSSPIESEGPEFDLSDFSIYVSPASKKKPLKLEGLQHHFVKIGSAEFLFDGILSVGEVHRYVQGVPLHETPIGNYGKEEDCVGNKIWVRSKGNAKLSLYYRLKKPSPEYERFHTGFVWIANLAKHFVDFCHSCGPKTVTASRFRKEFAQWIWDQHKESHEFRGWFAEYRNPNFLPAVSVNIGFLEKECHSIDATEGSNELRSQPIFRELRTLEAVPKQRIHEDKTIVTPYVYDLFSHLGFGPYLKSVQPISAAALESTTTGVSPTASTQLKNDQSLLGGEEARSIKVGDVLSVAKDDSSVWKDEETRFRAIDHCWYVYVLAVHIDKDGEPEFDVIWLYKPSDTSCGKMKYPYENELFMSNHCNCGRKNERIHQEEVLKIESVLWNSSPPRDNEQLFIRQTFMDQERFVTLAKNHKGCRHHPSSQSQKGSSLLQQFPIGQIVLVMPLGRTLLEPFEIVKYLVPESGRPQVVLRHLLRRGQFDGTGRPNELIYTDTLETFPSSRLYKKCLVRFYSEDDALSNNIPAPYNRNGTGNAFYICTRLSEKQGRQTLVPILEDLPHSLLQGFDPKEIPIFKKLRGMDLYCGGGNFGRGIEEGGAVHHEWAVDIYNAAIHTYLANLEDPDATKMFFGSVNDLLAQAMAGNPKGSNLIPAPGDVDFISAGSPCQGFSSLNPNKDNAKGLANQSLVASVAAYIDFFRPKYGLLENVLNMAQKGSRRDVDPLSQLICALVGMGYQLQVFLLDAWSCGSPQSRSRIFVSFAAPGLEPLQHPELSHAHPPGQKDLALGMLANGKGFGERKTQMTPFGFVNIADTTRHLPFIGDGATSQCTQYPYHVVANRVNSISKQQITCIPTRPRGMNFYKTWLEGKGQMTTAERELFPEARGGKQRLCILPNSKAWGRIDPGKLMPTVIVHSRPEDARMGRCLHWDQHRIMTVAEAKIAQGFLGGEVLVGTPADWWKLLGNSVCRTVSMALGLSLREAWSKSASNVAQGLCSKLVIEQAAKPYFLDTSTNSKALSANALPTTSETSNTRVKPEQYQFLPIRPPNSIANPGSLLEKRSQSTSTRNTVPLFVTKSSQFTIVTMQTRKMTRIISPPTRQFQPIQSVKSRSSILTSTSATTTTFSEKVGEFHDMSSDDSEDPILTGGRGRITAGAFPVSETYRHDTDDNSGYSPLSSSEASPEPSQEAAIGNELLQETRGNASSKRTTSEHSSFTQPRSTFGRFKSAKAYRTPYLPIRSPQGNVKTLGSADLQGYASQYFDQYTKAAVNGRQPSGNKQPITDTVSEDEDEISRAPTLFRASEHLQRRSDVQASNLAMSKKRSNVSVTKSPPGLTTVGSSAKHKAKRHRTTSQVVIDVLSSDEELEVKGKRAANQTNSQLYEQTSTIKYEPVDNSGLEAYARTSDFLAAVKATKERRERG